MFSGSDFEQENNISVQMNSMDSAVGGHFGEGIHGGTVTNKINPVLVEIMGFTNYFGEQLAGIIKKRYRLESTSYEIVVTKIQDGHEFKISYEQYIKEVKEYIKNEIEPFTRKGRADILSSFVEEICSQIIPDDLKTILEEYLPAQDIIDVINKVFIEEHFKSTFQDLPQVIDSNVKLLEWMMMNKPALHSSFLICTFYNKYIFRQIARRLSSEWLRNNPDKKIEDMFIDGRLAGQILKKEEAYDILKKFSSTGILEFGLIRNKVSEMPHDNYMLKQFSDVLPKKAKESDHRQVIDIPSREVPVVFFADDEPYGHNFHTVIKQFFFRTVFDLNIDQLKELSSMQKKIYEQLTVQRGRFQEEAESNEWLQLLDRIIISKTLSEVEGRPSSISSDDFSSVFKVSASYDPHAEKGKEWEIYPTMEPLSNMAHEMIRRLDLDSDSPEARAKAFRFFTLLHDRGVIGHYEQMDQFCEILAGSRIGLDLFTLYKDWLNEPQLPKEKDANPEFVYKNKISYLEALARHVDLIGPKAKIFKKYLLAHPEMLDASLPLDERWGRLKASLTKATLFRDGIIDRWERELLPEIDFSREEKVLKFLLNQKENSEGYDDLIGMIQATFMTLPMQSERLKKKDRQGHFIPFKLTEAKARELLAFYKEMIPQVANPQRQWRMGATAIRIYRQINPTASYQDELQAILTYYPMADVFRDEELDILMERHEIPSEKVSEDEVLRTRLLYSRYQRMEYDPERTNLDYMEQMFKALLSAANRQDRLEILSWLLDPKNPKPKMIQNYEDTSHVDFSDLLWHFSLMPKAYRMRIFEAIFLGENGLFSPHLTEDEQMTSQAGEVLFNAFFSRDQKQNRRQQFDPKTYAMIKDIFGVLLMSYPPGMRTEMVLSLLEEYENLADKPDGEKLAILLSALGPEATKFGQILSENSQIITDADLRGYLGSLKSRATPISTMDVIEVILSSGIPLKNIRIGKRLKAASMKQIHAGEYWVDDHWVPVVIKVIRPRIVKIRKANRQAIKAVLEHIKKEYDKDFESIALDVDEWIDIESDLTKEAQNSDDMRDSLEIYAREAKNPLPLNIPRIYFKGHAHVMIEERVKGEGLGTAIKELGAAKNNAAMKVARDMVRRVRQYFLFSILNKKNVLKDKKICVHGDFHSENIMEADESLFLIDLGFILRFNAQQIDGVRSFLKGILLHDQELVFQGIKMILAYSSKVLEEDREDLIKHIDSKKEDLLIDIQAVFKQHQHISNEMQMMTSVVARRMFQGQADFSAFIKAFTTASWLFPTTLTTAKATFDDLAEALDLKTNQKIAGMAIHAPGVLKGIVSQPIQGMTKIAKRAVLPAHDYVSTKTKWIMARWEAYQLIRRMRQKTDMPMPINDKESDSREAKASSLPTVDTGRVIATAPIDKLFIKQGDLVVKGEKVKTNEEALKAVVDKYHLTQKESNILRSTIREYFLFLRYFQGTEYQKDTLSSLDKFIVNVNSSLNGTPDFTEFEIIARVLATRLARRQVLDKEISLDGNRLLCDFLLPQDPAVRDYWEKIADAWIFKFELDRGQAFKELYKKVVKSKEDTFDLLKEEPPRKLYIFEPANPEDSFTRHSSVSGLAAPLEYMDQGFLESIVEKAGETLTNKNSTIESGHWAAHIERKSFSAESKLIIDVYDHQQYKLIHWELTLDQLQLMARQNTKVPTRVDQWELIRPENREAWKEMAKEQFDRAMKAHRDKSGSAVSIKQRPVGGIDMTPARMNLQMKTDSHLRGNDIIVSVVPAKAGTHLKISSPHVAQSFRGNDGMRAEGDKAGIIFHISPAMLARYQNAQGLMPVIVKVKPLKSFQEFLGLPNEVSTLDQLNYKN